MKVTVKATHLRRIVSIPSILLALLLLQAVSVLAAPAETFPLFIPLPTGFRPEGIAVGRGTDFFVGSIPTGAIYRGDLRTGEGGILVPAQSGRAAIGLSVDKRTNYLFVAGGGTGNGYVYDAETGLEIAAYQFTTSSPTFVNDVVVTRSAAYFTDSFRPYLYRVPLSAGGALPDQSAVAEIPLTGDFTSVPGFNTNGIDATPNGKWLFIVHSTLGELYRVDPQTGDATLIDLGGGDVVMGDGILLDGKTLYVVQNRLHRIAVVELDPGLAAGEITSIITDPKLDGRVPTTIAEFGNTLYAVNARFGTPMPDTADYEVVGVSKR